MVLGEKRRGGGQPGRRQTKTKALRTGVTIHPCTTPFHGLRAPTHKHTFILIQARLVIRGCPTQQQLVLSAAPNLVCGVWVCEREEREREREW
jgi:hypothetical protein